MERVYTALKPFLNTIRLSEYEPMALHTTFRIGGPARFFLQTTPETPVPQLLAALHQAEVPVTIIGRGSNLLVSDRGVSGVVLCTLGLSRVTVRDSLVTAQAGASLAQAAAAALSHGLTGAEFAAGIPGTVGGAVFMNAGAYDGSMEGIVQSSEYVLPDGSGGCLQADAHRFGYRDSVYKAHPERLILSACLKLEPGSPDAIRAKMDDFAARRREKQPLEFPSAGSTFKRPEGHFAGSLIEDCGLKGYSVGGAQVSEKHAGFLINRGGATADDMHRLIEAVRDRVYTSCGVELQCEVRFL